MLHLPKIPRPDRGYDREKVQMCIRMRPITDGFCKKSASKLRSRIEAVKGGDLIMVRCPSCAYGYLGVGFVSNA